MIKIITCNIRFDNPKDLNNSWTNRKKFLATTLKKEKAQIICTQEGREPQLRELENLLEMQLVDEHREWIKERMYPCIYIDSSINIVDQGDFWLSYTPNILASKIPESAFPRLCTWAKVQIEDYTFCIFNVHLDHTTDYVRKLQSKILLDELRKISNRLPFILLGDFNTPAKESLYDEIINSLDIIDTWSGKEEQTFHQFKGDRFVGKRIDWILCSSSFEFEKTKVLKDSKEGLYLSDHYPVVTNLKII